MENVLFCRTQKLSVIFVQKCSILQRSVSVQLEFGLLSQKKKSSIPKGVLHHLPIRKCGSVNQQKCICCGGSMLKAVGITAVKIKSAQETLWTCFTSVQDLSCYLIDSQPRLHNFQVLSFSKETIFFHDRDQFDEIERERTFLFIYFENISNINS